MKSQFLPMPNTNASNPKNMIAIDVAINISMTNELGEFSIQPELSLSLAFILFNIFIFNTHA